MGWISNFLLRWRIARDARRAEYLKTLAAMTPGYQWILVRAGTSEQARSPMLSLQELRDWFNEYYTGFKIVHIDEDNKIVFYE